MEFVALLPMVAIVSVFTFIAVANWSDNRRKEREAYYRHETYRKMLEGSEALGQGVLDRMREEDERQEQRRIDGLRLGGLVTTALGVGLMVFLYFLIDDAPIFLAGLLLVLVGLVLLAYGLFAARRQRSPRSHARTD